MREGINLEEVKKTTTTKKNEKVKVKILKKDSDDSTIVPVGINGKFYSIPVGQETEVPLNVKRLLEKGGYI